VSLARPCAPPALRKRVTALGDTSSVHWILNASGSHRRVVSLHWASDACRIDLSKTREHDHPFMFARLVDGGPFVHKQMVRTT